jgi:murein L,D-transpeptidase YafK
MIRLPALLLALLTVTAMAVEPAHEYEQRFLRTIQDIQQLNHDQALNETRQFIEQYPTSKIGQLVYGDLLMAKAGIVSDIGSAFASTTGIDDLKFEIKQRLSHKQAPALSGMLPENIIQIAQNQPYVILIDQSQSRLYVYRNEQGMPVLENDYFLTIGIKGFGKQKRGDQKTPIGVYHVTRYIDDKELPDLYGRGAFPVNYPNVWDKRKKRSGGGIWLHGTPSYTYNRAPWASNGCMVVSNNDFTELQRYIDAARNTPIINASHVNWISPQQWRQNQQEILQQLTRWIDDWESNNLTRYLQHYSTTELRAEGRNFKQFEGHKRWVNRGRKDINVEFQNLAIYRYPDEPDLVLMQYDQTYHSNNLNIDSPKELYWKKQGNRWKIVYEGIRHFNKPEDALVEN